MKKTIQCIIGAAIALSAPFATAQEPAVETVPAEGTAKIAPVPAEETVIQLAILLDTSSSMSGLIEQAKTQLWSIVNQFISAKQMGKTPVVQVALYEYGKSSLSKKQNWIRQIQPLTRDLDKISQELFKLKTNGGDEFCGAVIAKAIESLDWSASSDVYKAIFIAGNEPFTQGPISPEVACKAAITKGVIVNTIHCGDEQAGIIGGWKQGALLADGSYMIINQNQALAHIDAPQDDTIVELNKKLNDTYVTYGRKGEEAKMNQIAQDSNASGIAKGNLASRARTKASSNYYNASWDIVDKAKEKDFKWSDIKKEELPEELKKLSTEELKAHVAKKTAERAEVQKKLLKLTEERESYVAEKRKEMGGDESLGKAVVDAVKKQAATKGVTFGK